MKKKIQGKNIISIIYKLAIFWFLIGYIVLPIFHTLQEAITKKGEKNWGLFVEYLLNPKNQVIITNTLKLGLITVLICGVIGISMAFFMTFHCTRFKKLLHLILLTPMMVPGVVIVISYFQLYSASGILTSIICHLFKLESAPYTIQGFWGIVFVHALTQYVHFYLQTYIALKYVDYSEIEVARGMGASKWHIFKDVIFPAIKPALVLSTTQVLVLMQRQVFLDKAIRYSVHKLLQ